MLDWQHWTMYDHQSILGIAHGILQSCQRTCSLVPFYHVAKNETQIAPPREYTCKNQECRALLHFIYVYMLYYDCFYHPYF